ncbi:MAG TPA: hypothetical protein VLH75_18955 [Longimicrobiales bacterium]|nr:hypothetical protein [Longimicrobiales bacterium]
MKTTVEISDPLFTEARILAASEDTSLRALIEEGLRRLLEERRARSDFVLRRATFCGRGLRPEIREGSWERIRDLIYEGRGA